MADMKNIVKRGEYSFRARVYCNGQYKAASLRKGCRLVRGIPLITLACAYTRKGAESKIITTGDVAKAAGKYGGDSVECRRISDQAGQH